MTHIIPNIFYISNKHKIQSYYYLLLFIIYKLQITKNG